jgi:predicted nucleotidyltransferase
VKSLDVSDDRGNVVYYSIRRVIELLTQANPNILELLFMPDDCVRKTSTETLNEWLGSPITYREISAFRTRLLQLIPEYFNSIAAIHHYRSMADRATAENLVNDCIGIKKLFYVLRPLLACRWIEHTAAQPPTEFQKLMTAAWVGSEERNWIATLLGEKSIANEAQRISLERSKMAGIQAELERYKSAAKLVASPMKSKNVELDELFRAWIERT